jgi:hypothetical protein
MNVPYLVKEQAVRVLVVWRLEGVSEALLTLGKRILTIKRGLGSIQSQI